MTGNISEFMRLPNMLKSVRLLGKLTSISGFLFLACIAPNSFAPISAVHAQELPQTNPDAQLLLKADQLVYDNDAQKITAIGNVQLSYDGYDVVADRVTYNQSTRRVKASGNVEILEPSGNKIHAQEIDLTDDFSQGFVNALRVETPDKTYVAAESSERLVGGDTEFHHGVYTACEPCKEKPDKAPIWQVKAQKIIVDGKTKDFTYKHARLEMFGVPILYTPYFSHADPAVKRKSGFLRPSIWYASDLGFSLTQPYFLVTGDSHDLTVTPTYYSKQGFLGEARWRHQLENGRYEIHVAGIDQKKPDQFENEPDKSKDKRGMFSTRGQFNINPRWAFGWNFLGQSDSNFSRTYGIDGYDQFNVTNKVYLEGLNDKSFFNLSAKQYLIQNSTIAQSGQAFQFRSEQPFVRPVWDYNYVTTDKWLGGELSLDMNAVSLDRSTLSTVNLASGDDRTHGIEGDTTRLSADLGWKKSFVAAGGFSVTPSLSMRGDWTSTNGFAEEGNSGTGNTVTNGNYTRFMPTAGLEVSYPVLMRTAGSSHVFEPTAQIFLRPDLDFDGVAANEDAQSLVFDATTLFQHDKFSGYDRIESGTRANIGLRYSGQFDTGLAINGVFGQSFNVAGDNPYAREDDLTNTGEESGLESNRSDYVAALSFANNSGFDLGTQARFDERDFDLKRAEAVLGYTLGPLYGATNYTYIAAQPDYAFDEDREQVGFSGGWRFAENWTAFGGIQYDLKSNVVISDSLGLTYADDCFKFTLSFNETRSRSGTTEVSRSVKFNIALRTLGEYGTSLAVENGLESFSN